MSNRDHPVRRVASAVAGAAFGLVVSGIVVLNLHILSGLEEGYAASAQEVWDHSVPLALTDVALLVAGAVVGGVTAWRRVDRHHRTHGTDGPSSDWPTAT